MDLSTLPDIQRIKPLPVKHLAICKPIDDPTPLIGAATWTLEEGLNLLATLQTDSMFNEGDDRAALFRRSWLQTHEVMDKTLINYELVEKTFLIFAQTWTEDPNNPVIFYCYSAVYPDKFIEWATEMSLTVPGDFYQKLMRAQKRHIARRESGKEELSAKERRELGRLRREKEDFDLAIKATVKAVQFAIKVDRRVKRSEFLKLLNNYSKDGVSKGLVERIIPLLPPEYRETSGAPSTCKIGDPNEPES